VSVGPWRSSRSPRYRGGTTPCRRARSDFDGSTNIRAKAANIQSSTSLPDAGQSVGVLKAPRLITPPPDRDPC
jgi:hypothetical protein